MTLQGYWATNALYKIIEVETGREQSVLIPCVELLEKNELEDIILAMHEEAEADFKKPQERQLSRDQQHDLGGVLMDIRESSKRRRETGHGKYW